MSPAADTLNLPEDLLAVLGWDWGTLHRSGEGWKGSLAVSRRESGRSRQAETQFERTVAHLARTLEETPAQFHYRLRAARWSVALRRSVPLLACLGIIAAASSVSRLGLAQNSPIRMLIFNAPPLLLMLVFCLREVPRLEIPPLPRASKVPTWRTEAR
jgi:hypothetical protein